MLRVRKLEIDPIKAKVKIQKCNKIYQSLGFIDRINEKFKHLRNYLLIGRIIDPFSGINNMPKISKIKIDCREISCLYNMRHIAIRLPSPKFNNLRYYNKLKSIKDHRSFNPNKRITDKVIGRK